jgi:hypothetical protein
MVIGPHLRRPRDRDIGQDGFCAEIVDLESCLSLGNWCHQLLSDISWTISEQVKIIGLPRDKSSVAEYEALRYDKSRHRAT